MTLVDTPLNGTAQKTAPAVRSTPQPATGEAPAPSETQTKTQTTIEITSAAETAISVHGVTRVFGHGKDHVVALDGIDLTVRRGELVSVLGASGCGKTTLLNILAGLDRPTSGSAAVQGRVGLMFQESALFPWQTVRGNVETALRLRGVPRRERRGRTDELLRSVRLDGFGDKRPHELSGGMRQRAALARALAQNAEVLLMDEPFGALDAITREVLHGELERQWQEHGLTILFVTHDVREAVRLGDRVVLLSSRPGRVRADFEVTLPRPRRLDDAEVGELAATITAQLHQEVRSHARDDLDVRPPGVDALDAEIAGLDALEFPASTRPSLGRRVWSATWPKLAALTIGLTVWTLVVWSDWRPKWVLPWPWTVFSELRAEIVSGRIPHAVATTLERAAYGFALASLIGGVLGVAVSRWKVLRSALGSFITGLQTMPSIAWFPLAILLFKKSEGAITFVVVLGAAPSIANGVINGSDHVSPLLLRSGRVLGAKGLGLYRTVTFPASMPSIIGGLKQGWAFAWRSLLAGELLVIIAKTTSIGVDLSYARELADAPALQANMLVILFIGIVIDALFFGTIERFVRKRWGLIDPAG